MGPAYAVADSFEPGARFCDVTDLYVFDKKLRSLVLDAVERVEVALRVDVALHLGALDPLAHRDARFLHPNFTTRTNRQDRTHHAEWLDRLDDAAARSSEESVKHFASRCSSPLPIWIAIEVWDFGQLSPLIGGLRHGDRTAMASRFGIPRADLLASWVRAIDHVRNVCAHHPRLWNRSIVDEPKPPRSTTSRLTRRRAAGSMARWRSCSTSCDT